MAEPAILKHQDWAGLIAELAMRDGLSYLCEIPLPVASAVLAAPAAIARWIALCMPQLAAAPELAILVIGAETTDAPDQGRWYQLIPELLDLRCGIKVTLIGQELDTGFSSAAAAHAPAVAAQCHREALSEFLIGHPAESFDLAVVFQPGLQKHRDWLTGGGFARLIAAGLPVIGSSYEADEYEVERWVLECYGYRVSAEPVLNPFFLELSDLMTSVRWGRALWQIEAAPRPGSGVNQERLDALDTLTRMVMHSITQVRTPSSGYGTHVELRAANQKSMPLVHIFDNRFVEVATGKLSWLTAGGELREVGSLPAEAVASYPGTAAREIERAVWAAEMKSRYLLESYPSNADAVDAKAASRGMLTAMREKAARLFK